mmetsp:Transcript_98305/g.233965  ORF Transcript_98305/g.233965 Transcript_98305/m.233965 type:complete len:332 (+) Transcript_98305:198-1193(+)
MREVWKAPPVFSILACSAPLLSAKVFSSFTAFSVPAQEKPLGKRALAMRHTLPGPAFFSASTQHCSSSFCSKPATDSIACFPTWAASCMASPRSFTSRRPSSKLSTPAAHSAVYSPKESPAMHRGCSAAGWFCDFSLQMPARPPTNMAGWQNLVSASLSSGPFRHISKRSYPKISLAWESISFTSALSFTPSNMLTYWEPCPGKINAIGKVSFALSAFSAFSAFAVAELFAAAFGAVGSDFGSTLGSGLGSAYSFRLFPMPSAWYQPGGVFSSAAFKRDTRLSCLNFAALSLAVSPVLGSLPSGTTQRTWGSAWASRRSFTAASWPAMAAM